MSRPSLLVPSVAVALAMAAASSAWAEPAAPKITIEHGNWESRVWDMPVESRAKVESAVLHEVRQAAKPGDVISVKLSPPHGINLSFSPMRTFVRVIADVTIKRGKKTLEYEGILDATKGALSVKEPFKRTDVEPEPAPAHARAEAESSHFRQLKERLAREGITLVRDHLGYQSMANPFTRTIHVGDEIEDGELDALVEHEATHIRLAPAQIAYRMFFGPVGDWWSELQADTAAQLKDPAGFARLLHKTPGGGIMSPTHANPLRLMHAAQGSSESHTLPRAHEPPRSPRVPRVRERARRWR